MFEFLVLMVSIFLFFSMGLHACYVFITWREKRKSELGVCSYCFSCKRCGGGGRGGGGGAAQIYLCQYMRGLSSPVLPYLVQWFLWFEDFTEPSHSQALNRVRKEIEKEENKLNKVGLVS